MILPLYRFAKVIRSKNAKPYRLTLDILFDDRQLFNYVKNKGVLTRESISKIYGVEENIILSEFVFDAGMAFKFTMKRPLAQGEPGDSDIYGAQQHSPLMFLEVPLESNANLLSKLKPEI